MGQVTCHGVIEAFFAIVIIIVVMVVIANIVAMIRDFVSNEENE